MEVIRGTIVNRNGDDVDVTLVLTDDENALLDYGDGNTVTLDSSEWDEVNDAESDTLQRDGEVVTDVDYDSLSDEVIEFINTNDYPDQDEFESEPDFDGEFSSSLDSHSFEDHIDLDLDDDIELPTEDDYVEYLNANPPTTDEGFELSDITEYGEYVRSTDPIGFEDDFDVWVDTHEVTTECDGGMGIGSVFGVDGNTTSADAMAPFAWGTYKRTPTQRRNK